MLEEHTTIDTIARSKDGRIELVITDAGETTNPKERFNHLVEKLKSYVYYVVEGDFKKDFPDKGIQDVSIRVMCRVKPTPEMSKLTRLSDPSDPENGINVFYQTFPGSAAEPRPTSARPSPVRIKITSLVLLVLGALALVASLLGSFSGKGFADAIICGVLGIVFIAVGYGVRNRA